MRLLIDIGNTRLKWGVEKDGLLQHSSALPTQQIMQRIEAPEQIQSAIVDGCSEVWVSSVAQQQVVERITEHWFSDRQVNVVRNEALLLDYKNAYQNPSQLGVDRWVAALGGRSLIKSGGLIIVDAGTAITIDWLDSQDCFQGGMILPGLALMHDALVGKTANINSRFHKPQQTVGRTTAECVNSGVHHCALGGVLQAVTEIKKLANDVRGLLITGGDAERFVGSLTALKNQEFKVLHENDLVLRGLLVIAQQTQLLR